jgi:hypothetical protein
MLTPLETVENAEFVIERRAAEPFYSNRFYCIAPMRTPDHIATLERIDEFLSTPKRRKAN